MYTVCIFLPSILLTNNRMGPHKIKVEFLVASQPWQFCETLETRVKLNLNFPLPHAINYTNYKYK